MPAKPPCLPELDALRLIRDGTTQDERYVPALDPALVPVLGRTPAETLLYARAYAAKLSYFDASNTAVGTWREFFARDVSTLLATAATQDLEAYRRTMRAAEQALLALQNNAAEDRARQCLSFQFAAAATVAARLDSLMGSLPTDFPLRATLRTLIRTRLTGPLDRLLGYTRVDVTLPVANRLLLDDLDALPADLRLVLLGEALIPVQTLFTSTLSDAWTRAGETWADHVATIAADDSVFGDPGAGIVERARCCSSHALFRSAIDHFVRALARTVRDAKLALDATLTNYAKHAPHYALFLAFVRLFERARTEINGLSQRHLDFYYREVLRLTERLPAASQVHLTVELAKGVPTCEVTAGTAFKAGKDSLGKAVTFASTSSLVANRARLAAVKRLYRENRAGSGAGARMLRADADPHTAGDPWRPFENEGQMPRLGFAVASHYLYLAEGTRTITLVATMEDCKATATSLTEHVVCRLTTEKGWLELRPSTCSVDASGTLTLVLEVDGEQPAITAFAAGVHEASYNVSLPILEILLADSNDMLGVYESLEPALLATATLTVTVDALRSLAVSTDLGPVDPAKPFQPFGPSPVPGSALRLGCPEAFMKGGVSSASINLSWRNLPASLSSPSLMGESQPRLAASASPRLVFRPFSEDASVEPQPSAAIARQRGSALSSLVELSRLAGGQWMPPSDDWLFQYASEGVDITELAQSFNREDRNDVAFATPYSLDASTGYVKIALKTSLGHDTYATALATYVATIASGQPADPVPVPYTPELESISLSYTAVQTLSANGDFASRRARFYHVHAYGVAEQHADLGQEDTVYLLPQLRSQPSASEPVPATHAGELYLGFSDVAAPQNIALLFQVEDGTANPRTAKPRPHLRWSYLCGNEWMAFADSAVADGSAQFLQSGIVTLAIPVDASVDDSLMPGGLTWIRVAVSEACDAVCALQAVLPQALTARFVDQDNAPDFLATPLAAGTISKLATPLAQVKSIAQPFTAFGGRVAESPASYYTRVSERLRHKNRSIALWDYERLVLDRFPSIHRLKCLNHTRYEAETGSAIVYHELAAGHVTLIPIPRAATGSVPDPLKPYVSLSTLDDIRSYLEQRCPCFATLHVCNPIYEEVRVVCTVKLRSGSDESQSDRRLRRAITQFLAPWAFQFDRHPSFEGKIVASAIIDFIEDQPYVDYLTDFKLYHDVDGVAGTASKTVVEGICAASILAPAPEASHRLELLRSERTAGKSQECVE